MKTNELIGPALNWAVAKCKGLDIRITPSLSGGYNCIIDSFKPSIDWAQGGPIIEREGISTLLFEGQWFAFNNLPIHDCIKDIADGYVGPTPLVAAMRAYVASKLGDDVDIPEGL